MGTSTGTCALSGARVSLIRSCALAPHSPEPRCRADQPTIPRAASLDSVVSDAADRHASKYQRILQFVEDHSPVSVSSTGSIDLLQTTVEEGEEDVLKQQQQQWHHSYDEEAMEGSSDIADEEDCLCMAADMQLIADSAAVRSAVSAPSMAPVSVYQVALCRARLANAAPHLVSPSSSWAYGSAAAAKPWYFSYDEEAEGTTEEALAAAMTPMQAYMAAQAKKQAVHEARHAARVSRASRRATLRASLGDLEQMPPWVDPAAAAAAVPAGSSSRPGRHQPPLPLQGYGKLLPMAAEAVLMKLQASEHLPEARHPQSWQFTWDEEAHGGMNDGVLGSC